MIIEEILAKKIFDNRGNPTIEVEVYLEEGFSRVDAAETCGGAAAPEKDGIPLSEGGALNTPIGEDKTVKLFPPKNKGDGISAAAKAGAKIDGRRWALGPESKLNIAKTTTHSRARAAELPGMFIADPVPTEGKGRAKKRTSKPRQKTALDKLIKASRTISKALPHLIRAEIFVFMTIALGLALIHGDTRSIVEYCIQHPLLLFNFFLAGFTLIVYVEMAGLRNRFLSIGTVRPAASRDHNMYSLPICTIGSA